MDEQPDALALITNGGADSIDFIYRVDGDNQLGLDELVPILISLGEMIQETNQVLDPEAPDIEIAVRPFKEGSFHIELTLMTQEQAHALFTAVQTGSIHYIWTVLTTLGVIASKAREGYTSVLDLIRKLKGKPPASIKKRSENTYEVRTHDGDVIQINDKVGKVYRNCTIIENLSVAYSEPLKKPSRKKVQSYLKDDPETMVEVGQEDAPALEHAQSPEPEPAKISEAEHTFEVFVSPKRGSFEGDGQKWSFRKGGRNGEVIQANIKDATFLHKLETGEYRLSGNDVLRVQLHEKQRVVGTTIKTTNDILKVLDYRKAADISGQMNMFDSDQLN